MTFLRNSFHGTSFYYKLSRQKFTSPGWSHGAISYLTLLNRYSETVRFTLLLFSILFLIVSFAATLNSPRATCQAAVKRDTKTRQLETEHNLTKKRSFLS